MGTIEMVICLFLKIKAYAVMVPGMCAVMVAVMRAVMQPLALPQPLQLDHGRGHYRLDSRSREFSSPIFPLYFPGYLGGNAALIP